MKTREQWVASKLAVGERVRFKAQHLKNTMDHTSWRCWAKGEIVEWTLDGDDCRIALVRWDKARRGHPEPPFTSNVNALNLIPETRAHLEPA